MKFHLRVLFLGIFCCLLLLGCSKYVLVQMRDTQKYPPKPDEVLGNSLSKVDRSMVIQMPDSCYESQSRAVTSGQAIESNVVLSTHCSNWVTGVEKELVRKGFNVKSSLELAITLKQAKRTLVEAAREIGAGTVLQINSLEFPVLVSDPKSLQYFKSNAHGEKLAATQLQDFYIKKISAYVKDAIENSGRIKAGMLDCKIIDVKTQDTVYYFSHKVKADGNEGDFLFLYSNNYSILPVKPGAPGGSCLGSMFGSSPPPETSGQTLLFTDQVVDPLNRQKEILAEKLSQEFVRSFSQAVGGN